MYVQQKSRKSRSNTEFTFPHSRRSRRSNTIHDRSVTWGRRRRRKKVMVRKTRRNWQREGGFPEKNTISEDKTNRKYKIGNIFNFFHQKKSQSVEELITFIKNNFKKSIHQNYIELTVNTESKINLEKGSQTPKMEDNIIPPTHKKQPTKSYSTTQCLHPSPPTTPSTIVTRCGCTTSSHITSGNDRSI